MKLQIIGNGAFGSFMQELLAPHFELTDDAYSIVLAIPFSAYEKVASDNKNKHFINVCSVQKPSTDICLKYSDFVTSIHPLFGRRTPNDKRNSILTYTTGDNDTWDSGRDIQFTFLERFRRISNVYDKIKEVKFTPESHDILMRKTHCNAAIAAKQLKVYIEQAKDIPDEFIPHSFRLMREFVQTLDDMPQGTMESILANEYF
jgi:prephenate dehydrogenase